MTEPLTATTLRGVWGSVLLPIEADDGIDWSRLESELHTLAGSPLDGVYAHGTAGEFHLLLDDEFERVSAMLAQACASTGIPFQLGVSHPVPQVSLARIASTRALEPAAFQVILPDWLPLTDAEVESYLRRVADVAAPTPLVLYNPPHAKTALTPGLLSRLLDAVPSLVGVKVAGGDGAWFDAMSDVIARCAVFVPGHHLASGVARGARGSYSNVAALSPTGAARWYAQMTTDPEAALDLERRIGLLFERHIAPLQRAGLSNPALDKFLAAIGAWSDIGVRVRWPYKSASESLVADARTDAREMVPELFEV